MSKHLFNEAEIYLVENWSDARLIERSLSTMREKYEVILEKVLGAVQQKHPELNCRAQATHLKVDEEEDEQRGVITIGLGRKAWPSNSVRNEPSGLWLSDIRLGELIVDSDRAPTANVFLSPPKDCGLDLAGVASVLEQEAKRILPEAKAYGEFDENAGWTGVGYALPETRKELLKLLLKDDSKVFIQRLVAHFENLAKLIPAVDLIFQ